MGISARQQQLLDEIANSSKAIAGEISESKESARVLSSHRERLIESYGDEWIAIFQNCVRTHGVTLK